jgi:hypothetical protein
MQAITTRHLPATNTKPGRIVAQSEAGHRLTLSVHAAPNGTDAHDFAVLALCERLGWKGDLMRGHTRTGRAYVFISERERLVNTTPRTP